MRDRPAPRTIMRVMSCHDPRNQAIWAYALCSKPLSRPTPPHQGHAIGAPLDWPLRGSQTALVTVSPTCRAERTCDGRLVRVGTSPAWSWMSLAWSSRTSHRPARPPGRRAARARSTSAELVVASAPVAAPTYCPSLHSRRTSSALSVLACRTLGRRRASTLRATLPRPTPHPGLCAPLPSGSRERCAARRGRLRARRRAVPATPSGVGRAWPRPCPSRTRPVPAP